MTLDRAGTVVLYHGTTAASAEMFQQDGWKPNSFAGGNHCGNTGLLYLTTDIENARWFANEKGCDTVLSLELPIGSLIVDPEDGVGETVFEEFEVSQRTGTPANFATRLPIPADRFAPATPSHGYKP